MNNMVSCDLCKAGFAVTRDALTEQDIMLEREGFPDHPAQMTILTCPHCGKSYPVIVDDETTIPLVQEMRQLYAKSMKYKSKGQSIPDRMNQRLIKTQRKLSFRRRQLAEKFNGSFYQTEDGKQQLEYRYHER